MLLVAFFIYIGICNAWQEERPVLQTHDGNLIIASAKDRNITLLTFGNSTVNINDVDLIQVSLHAQKATRIVEKWQSGYLRDLTANVDRLMNAIEGPDGLQSRLNVLEPDDMSLDNSTYSTAIPGVQLKYDEQVSRNALPHLRNRVDKLEAKLRMITTKLREDECATNPCKNGGTCINIYNGFKCICPSNWEGLECNVDINECSKFVGTALGCQNGATCINLEGSYSCHCSTGWHGIHCNTKSMLCTISNSRKLCGHGDCVSSTENDFGYTCDCDQGWQSAGTGLACTKDIDECLASQPKCSLDPPVPCINLPGGYKCGSCPPGYTGNGHQCIDIDECLVDNGGCSTEPMVKCENILGSRSCGNCPSGYQGDGTNCVYVGVCRINNGGCHPRANCIESAGFTNLSPQCDCPDGYHGDGVGPDGCEPGSKTDDPCARNPCTHGVCLITGDGYHCLCSDGFAGTNCESPVDRCTPNPCKNEGVCRVSNDSRAITCECGPNFSGPICDNPVQSCGGLFRNPSGTLKYPMANEIANENINCVYIIVTDKTKVLRLTFLQFDIEPSDNCESTYLQINDGQNDGAHQLGRFCNSSSTFGNTFTTTHNSVYLLLRSNNRTDRRKFFLRWDSIAPVCGGILIGDHGIISSPGSPGKYPQNRDCNWAVKVKPGKRIQFHFYSLMMEEHPTCDYDYLEINETTSNRDIMLGRFCNHSLPTPLLTSGSFAKIHFHSDAQGTDMGFQMGYSTVEGLPGCGGVFTADHAIITTPGYPSKYPSNIVCEWKIQLQQGFRVRLTWLALDVEPDRRCNYDSVQVFSGSDTDSPVVGKYCGNQLPAAVTINSNIVLIVFTSDHHVNERQGFQLSYTTVCGGEFREPSGFIKSIHYPSAYPQETNCIYEIIQPPHTGIMLNILDMDIIDSSVCHKDRLEIYEGRIDESSKLGKICGGSDRIPSEAYFSFQNFMYLKFSTFIQYASHRSGHGFLANYTTFKHDCGGIWTAPTGVIESAMDSNSGGCTWIIQAPEKHVVQITFKSFELANSSGNCSDHFVAIYDGVVGPDQQIGRYCTMSPPILTTQGSIMTIMHNSNDMESDDFEAHYIFIDTSKSCGGHYFASTGLVTTPNYPDGYPGRTSCEWVVTVANKRQITLNVKDFRIPNDTACHRDYLEVRAGGSEASILIGKYCGTSIPKTLKSFTNQMYLKFESFSYDQHGFSIEWESSTFGCGGTLTGSNGEILSPNYPQSYHHQANCVWKIRTNVGNLLRLVFVDFDIEADASCSSDYIEILTGANEHGRNSTRYCRMNSPYIDLDSNLATIRFTSDHRNSGRGFHIKYETVCVNKVRGFNGVIESPNFPDRYPGNANCSWIIEVPVGNTINLSFSNFIPHSDSLLFVDWLDTYLTVKEGSHDVPNKDLIKFSYPDKLPERMSSTQSQIFLRYKVSSYIPYRGFRLEWTMVGCGGHLRRPTGDFSTPGYPNSYPKDIQCVWLIEVDDGHSVEINFSEVDLEKVEGCRNHSIELYGGLDENAPKLATLCRSKSPTKFTSTTNKMLVKFIGNDHFSGRGWKASYKFVELTCGGTFRAAQGIIHSANYPLNYPSNQNCEWLIEVDKNHVVNLTFVDFDIEDTTNCVDNYVKVFDGELQEASLLGTFCKNELPPIVISTGNSMLVVMRSDGNRVTSKGFKAQFAKACGARIVTNGTGVLDTGLDSHISRTSRHCTWIIVASDPADHVTIRFSNIVILSQRPYEECGDHRVRIYDGEGTVEVLYDPLCASDIPVPITSSGNALTIDLYGDSYDRFVASYSVLESACGGEHLAASGTIASPGYPDNYPTNAECVWLLKTSPGNGLILTFSAFDLEPSPNCDRHYLEIRENLAIGKLIGIYCDNEPSSIVSNTNLWIKFKSDDIGTAQGFLANYAFKTDMDLTGIRGEISSPLYPYPWKGEDISWRITVDPDMFIRVEFDDLHIDSGDSCQSEVEIYDGYNSDALKLASVCGLLPPKDPIESTSNVIFIQYRHEYDNGHENWFHLNWYQVLHSDVGKNIFTEFSSCKAEYDIASAENTSVTFGSPGWPEDYENNLDCIWIITSPPGSHLKIKFTALDLEESDGCLADFVTVWKGNALAMTLDSSHLLKTACLKNEIDKTIQGSSVMTVKFHSDIFIHRSGFQAIVWRECGGEYNGPSGVIDSNQLWTRHDQTTLNITCEWFITVRPGRTINIEFDRFSVGANDKNGCHDNYLLLKNGAAAESPLLGAGKFCDQSKPSPALKTTGNKLYVKVVGFQRQVNFKMIYKEVSFSCGYSVRLGELNNRVEFKSPNYPNIPPPFSECFWTFLAPAGERLTLHFIDRFDLTKTPNCTKEYVEVRDGGTQHSQSLGAYCGNIAPSTMTTTGNMLHVHFYTDVSDPKNGFHAVVSSGEVCGQYLRAEKGIVRSYHYPNTYPTNQECRWTIVGPPDHTLALVFQDLDLPLKIDNDCSDYVKIDQNNPFDTTTTEVGRWCGNEKPNSMEIISNEAVILFHSDNETDSHRGFSLNYTASKNTCGGEFFGPVGNFQTTGYPNPSTSPRLCEWSITVPEGSQVRVDIRDLDSIRLGSRLAFYNDKRAKSEITTIVRSTYSNHVFSSSNYMLVVYESGPGDRGFRAGYLAFIIDDSCGGPRTDEMGYLHPPGSPFRESSFFCQWKLRVPDEIKDLRLGTTLTVSISGFLGNYSRQSRSCEDRAKYMTINDPLDSIGMICGDVTKEPKIFRSPSPINIIDLMNGTHGGPINFEIYYYWKSCGGVLTGPSHTIASPEDMKYPRSCVWHAEYTDPSAVITMKFTRMNLGSCDKSYVLVRNGGPLSPVINSFCGDIKPATITSSTNELWIEYWAAESPGDFEFQLTLASGSCGGSFRGSSREFTSPGFPKQYPNNAECTWEITADPGHTIGLIFVDRFNIETSDNCDNDFVQLFNWVYEGEEKSGWDNGIKYCGRDPPLIFNSTSNRLKVLFRSDSAIQADGFHARWEQNCGGLFHATRQLQTIYSPHYPDVYPSNQICNYTIQAPEETAEILINFTDLDMESSDQHGDCKFDNITIIGYRQFGIHHAYFRTTGVICVANIPLLMQMIGNVNLVFRSDAQVERRGFRFEYMLNDCGGEITKPMQISSTLLSFDRNIDHINCTWIIRAPEGKSVVLRIEEFEMQSSYHCLYGELRAVEGESLNTETSLLQICGVPDVPISSVKSMDNVMTVTYRSDSAFGKMSAMVSFANSEASGCGGKIHVEDSKPFKTQRTILYEPFEDCQWKITVEPNQKILFTINRMDLINSTSKSIDGSCNGDYLEVRDGSHSGSDLIGRYCGDPPQPITSSSSDLWIKFFSDASLEGEGVSGTLEVVNSQCGSHIFTVIGDEMSVIESPEYPQDFTAGMECQWIFKSDLSSSLRIHLVDINMENSENCDGDRLEILHDDRVGGFSDDDQSMVLALTRMTNVKQRLYKYCGEVTSMDHYSDTNEVTIALKSTMENMPKPRRFKFEVQKATCNRNYTAEQGRIINGDDKECWITITAPPGHTISLYFYKINYYPEFCSTVYLKVYDGDFNSFERTICSPNDIVSIFSSGNLISLHSNSVYPVPHGKPHYDIQYTTTDKGRGCGGKLYNYQGIFTSPMYQNNYRTENICEWEVNVPRGYTIILEVLYFDLGGDDACLTDYLQFREMINNQLDRRVENHCTGQLPSTYMASTNQVIVTYGSSANNIGSGWKIRFTSQLASRLNSDYYSDNDYDYIFK